MRRYRRDMNCCESRYLARTSAIFLAAITRWIEFDIVGRLPTEWWHDGEAGIMCCHNKVRCLPSTLVLQMVLPSSCTSTD